MQFSKETMAEEKPSIDIQRYIKLLLQKKWLWIASTILCSSGAVMYASIMPDIYQSKCVISVEESKTLDSLLSKGGGRGKGQNARSVIGVVQERMLGWSSITHLIKTLDIKKELSEGKRDDMESLYKRVIRNVTISAKGAAFIEVKYQGENPETNYRIVDSLVSSFIESSLKESRTEADETVDFIEADLRRLKKNLEASELKLQQFEEDHFGELPGSENSKTSQLFKAEEELKKVNDDIMILEEKIGFLDKSKENENKTITGEVTRVPNPMVKDLKEKINQLEIYINSLRAKYFDEHPSIVKSLAELESLKKMLAQEEESIVSEEKIVNNPMYEDIMEKGFSAQLQLKTLQRHRNEIEKKIAGLKESIKSMPAIRQQMNELQRDYNVNKSFYEQRLLDKAKAELVKEMSLAAKTNPFSIVEPPRISYKPVKEKKIKIIGMGVVLGLGLGIGVIIGFDQIDSRFKTMDEAQNYLNIPALGMIPTIMTNTEIKRIFRKKIIISSSLAAFIIITTTVCLVVEPIKTIVNDKAVAGWSKLVEMAKR